MIIQPNWTVTDQGPWQLIYNDSGIISFLEVQSVNSTQGNVFAGTKEECEAEIERLGLPWVSEEARRASLGLPPPEPPEQPIYNESDSTIVFFGPKVGETSLYDGTEFLGIKIDCEAQIVMLNLSVTENSIITDAIQENTESGGLLSNAIGFFRNLFGA
jgi:hypothetical protein